MFGIYQSRGRYWSDLSLFIKIRKHFNLTRPTSATAEEWDDLHEKWEKEHKFVNWLTHDGIDNLQDFFYLPYDIVRALARKLSNRFVDQYFRIDTKLPKYEYHEIETRIFHGCFEMLINFVEVEKAHMQMWSMSDKEMRKKYGMSWYHRGILGNFFNFRSKDAGFEHLMWEADLKLDESYWGSSGTKEEAMAQFGDRYGKPTDQALKASAVMDLYLWYKARETRMNPYDLLPEREDKKFSLKISDEERVIFEKINELEEQYSKEDDEKLEQLIKLRRGLWT